MTAAPDEDGSGDPTDGPPLRTQPRSLVTHWLVDSAVLFLVSIIVALFFGVSWLVVLGIALVLGACVAPATRRADARAMAVRRGEPPTV